MLSVSEAQLILLKAIEPLSAEHTPLGDCLGRALAQDVLADRDYPFFDNSAVDGYAVRFRADSVHFRIVGTAAAGDAATAALGEGEAVRIFTGAPIPESTDAVIMQEDCQVVEQQITATTHVHKGQHIRRRGEDYRGGDLLIELGSDITPAVLGLLAAVGLTNPLVGMRPRIGWFTTGDELYDPSIIPPPGGIRDSNGHLLMGLLASNGIQPMASGKLDDDLQATRDALRDIDVDLIVTAGGVSVGDRDFVRQVAEQDGEIIFWRVAVKPGKPILFARIHNKWLLGLPGNPGAVLVTFELFVRPALRRLMGFRDCLPSLIPVTTDREYQGGKREEWLRVILDENLVARPEGLQGSHGQRSLAFATALMRVPAGRPLKAGDPTRAILLTARPVASDSS
jgi:molybdopterin molybdotransferase